MNAKNLVTASLLLFLAVAIITFVVRERGSHAAPEAAAESITATPSPEGLVAYYFHGSVRCPTCEKIESYAHQAIRTGFAQELDSGKIAWQVLDYESPANAHFATDFQIAAPTVVLVKTSPGDQAQWRKLSRVWQLVGDKSEFVEYIQAQTSELLAEEEESTE